MRKMYGDKFYLNFFPLSLFKYRSQRLYSQKSFATNTRIQSIRQKVESHIPRRFISLRLLTMKYVMFYGRDFGLGCLS